MTMFSTRESGNGVAPGMQSDRWTALGHQFRVVTPSGRKWLVVARCACGTIRAIPAADLNTHNSRSCGCWKNQPENKPDGSNEPRFLPTPRQIRAWQRKNQANWSDAEYHIRSTVVPVDELAIRQARAVEFEFQEVVGLHRYELQAADIEDE